METSTALADKSWSSGPSRRSSIETIYSIQGRETDVVRDTTDTESSYDGSTNFSDEGVEYEPATTEEEDNGLITAESSGPDDKGLLNPKVVEVSARDDGEVQFADCEQVDSETSDSEIDLCDYWQCAQCYATNNNPLYRYCEKCFKVRKNFFPPRPKAKKKRVVLINSASRINSQDSGVHSAGNSQEFSDMSTETRDRSRATKRRAESADRFAKRHKTDASCSDSDCDSKLNKSRSAEPEFPKRLAESDGPGSDPVKPLAKTVSDPILRIEESDGTLTREIVDGPDSSGPNPDLCITCLAEPKTGVFVHGNIAHICCCYKCAIKVWAKSKRCPICNRKVMNVVRGVVM